MSQNTLRQIKDIQVQADKIINRPVSLADIKNFKNYSEEIKNYLLANIQTPEIRKYIFEIPEIILEVKATGKDTWLRLLPTSAALWMEERRIIREARTTIRTIQGKYASIEFLLKNYFE